MVTVPYVLRITERQTGSSGGCRGKEFGFKPENV